MKMATSSSGYPNRIIENYFGKEIRVLKALGVSFTGNEGLAYKIYSCVILLSIVYAYPLLDTYELTKHDFDGIAGILAYQTGVVIGMAKTSVLLLNRIKFGKLLGRLGEAPFTPNLDRGGDVEEKLLKECCRITNYQTLSYWILSSATFCGILVYALRKRIVSNDYHDWQFTFGPLTVLNVTYSPNFEISFLYQNLSIIIIAGNFTSADLILAAVLAHISYQFKILQNCIRRLVKINKDDMNKEQLNQNKSDHDTVIPAAIPWKGLKKSLRETVRYHVEILDLAKDVEEVFNALLLFSFLGTLCLVCFSLNAASTANNKPLQMLYLFEVCSSAGQVFVVCYWSEQVLQESQLVGKATFEMEFVGTDPRFQRGLVLIIRRSQNPSTITAGKFTVVSLTTFAWLLRSSYSAFMILYKANQNKLEN